MNKGFIKLGLLIGGLILAVILAFGVVKTFATVSYVHNGKITLCHYDSGQGGKYTANDVSINSTDADGHDNHSNDIIPPYHYDFYNGIHHHVGDYPGKNFSGQGLIIWNNGTCVPPVPTLTPTPTPKPTSTPTPTLTPIPHHYACVDESCQWVVGHGDNTCNPEWKDDCVESTPTPTPTSAPQQHFACVDQSCQLVDGKGDNSCNPEAEVNNCLETTPTPTPTEEVTPTPTEAPCGDLGCGVGNVPSNPSQGGSYTPSVCSGIFPDAPKLQGFSVDGNGFISLSWWGVTTDKYSLRYGYKADDLNFGIPSIPSSSTSIQVGGLTPGAHVWAILTAYNGECATDSNEIDPVVK